jgi:predicted amidohydrolase YtcJ
VNLAHAVTRRYPGSPALGPKQRISLRSAVDAYTINGARMLGIDREAGSLRVGKSADFIVLDRDIFALAAAGNPDDIAKTQVLQTWFEGRRVYQRKAAR